MSLWSVLKRSGPRLLLFSLLAGGATYAGLLLTPSRYQSEAQLRIGGQGGSDPFRDPKTGTAVESSATRLDKEAIASQVVALRSRDLGLKLAQDLQLQTMPEFNSAAGTNGGIDAIGRVLGLTGPRKGESEDERVLSALFKALQVYQVKDTRVITIEFTANDSDFAARVANRLAELYQEWLRSQGVSQTTDASEWLKPQVDKLAREASEAESEVERFRSEANLFRSGGANASLNDQQLGDVNTELTKIRAARAEAEARAVAARDLLARNNPDSIQDVQKSPVIQALIAQRVRAEREKAEADTQLLPGHPRMKQLIANVNDLKRQINKEAEIVVDGLEKETKVLLSREKTAAKSLDEMKARIASTANDLARLASLEGQAKAKRRELEGLQASFEAARARVDVKAVPIEAQIISSARPSSAPTSPKRAQLSLLAAAATLMLGLVLTVTRELVRGPRPARGRKPASANITAADFNLPAGRLAPVRPTPARSSAPAHDSSMTMTEVAKRIVGNAAGTGGYRSVIVGESGDFNVREDAAELAGALADHGLQVVLIDWSMDGIGLSRSFGIKPKPGLMDLIDGEAAFDQIIQAMPDSDAHVIACGSARTSTPQDSDQINIVLDALDEAYDHVIVTGPYEAVRDLFLAVQGRFDAGIFIADRRRPKGDADAPGTFLGFDVTEIDVIRIERAPNRMARRKSDRRQPMRSEARA